MPDVSSRVHLTKRTVDAAQPGAAERCHWDDEVRGFGLRVKPNGAKSYVLNYRNATGRARRLTIGAHGVLTAETARAEARALRVLVAQGRDPAAERVARHAGQTVAAFGERYLTQHSEAHKKPGSIYNDRHVLRRYVVAALGSMQMTEVTRAEVTRLHQGLRSTPYLANRVLALLSHMMNTAER
jgi:hypothetical protein